MLTWKVIDEDYLNYLREHEPRIPYTNFGSDKLKPFLGSLFIIDDLMYVTQISSPKPRHSKMKEQLDFIKIFDIDRTLLGVINLNYMFPIPIDLVTDLQYKNIEKYVSFSNNIQKSKYISLLKKELNAINNKPVIENAKTVYNLKTDKPNSPIAQRSFDFKQLEALANKYFLNC